MTADIDLLLGGGAPLQTLEDDRVFVRLSKAPHLLVAGMTGAGKSVLVHDLICQTITDRTPNDVQLVFIDPKRVEFAVYKGLPHAAHDPVYDLGDIEFILGWARSEMMTRFNEMERQGWRDVDQSPWARLIVVIDEMANLMLSGKQFEKPIIDIASMGRAAGVHLILATQRPDATVINGLIRANVPTRVALPTITANESKIILDSTGAERLETPQRLIRRPGTRELTLAHGRWWKEADIQRTVWGARHEHG